ncbi:hypothetical protein NDU88_002862 [Pleurodeles waltl]|uniref:Uncharacterized protein n=1 Tax=Pleurodeles waltl TaxID=8319 RepID=A0AAV7QE31_PLEWA|nr:hypothetical protein NDU88_002862 [Pleurodeles waltl]
MWVLGRGVVPRRHSSGSGLRCARWTRSAALGEVPTARSGTGELTPFAPRYMARQWMGNPWGPPQSLVFEWASQSLLGHRQRLWPRQKPRLRAWT